MLPTAMELATSPHALGYTPAPGLEHVLEKDASASVDEEGKEEDGRRSSRVFHVGGQCCICRQELIILTKMPTTQRDAVPQDQNLAIASPLGLSPQA